VTLRPVDTNARQLLAELESLTDGVESPSGRIAVNGNLADTPPPTDAGVLDDPDALYALGKSHQARSAAVGNRILERYPDSYRARLMRGEAYEKGQPPDYDRALEEYRLALALERDLPGVQYAVGRILWKMRRWDEAVPYLKNELQRNPNHALANYYLGNSYLSLGDQERSIAYLEAAVRARPDLAQAHADLGRALAGAGRHEAAIAAFRKALQSDPEYPGIHAQMAVAFRALGRFEEAQRAADTARELSAKKNRPLR
jgi:tetratricopeptide (TPR) repeat protein